MAQRGADRADHRQPPTVAGDVLRRCGSGRGSRRRYPWPRSGAMTPSKSLPNSWWRKRPRCRELLAFVFGRGLVFRLGQDADSRRCTYMELNSANAWGADWRRMAGSCRCGTYHVVTFGVAGLAGYSSALLWDVNSA